MDKTQVKQLARHIENTDGKKTEIIETHISWVILAWQYVYKIKKPVKLEFLDFSTLDKRKHYCHREVELNTRLAEDIYLGTETIFEDDGEISFSHTQGEIIDYAVKMKKVDPHLRMDKVIASSALKDDHLYAIADELIPFHKNAEVMSDFDLSSFQQKFNALGDEIEIIDKKLGTHYAQSIMDTIITADNFIANHQPLFEGRLHDGFIRDCHGDLHTKNIFLTDPPTIFDCIEFRDDYRQLDVLSELAFLCMDLEAKQLVPEANTFFEYYNRKHLICRSGEEKLLFYYFKGYYANVRAKVNLIELGNNIGEKSSENLKNDAIRYIDLMSDYISLLD